MPPCDDDMDRAAAMPLPIGPVDRVMWRDHQLACEPGGMDRLGSTDDKRGARAWGQGTRPTGRSSGRTALSVGYSGVSRSDPLSQSAGSDTPLRLDRSRPARVILSNGDAADETNETMSVTTFGLTSLVVAAGDGPGG